MHTSPPEWRAQLDSQLKHNMHLPWSRFVQVATVRRDGRPANRTMTFRFFLGGNRLIFSADARTEKMAELIHNPWAEICWYFTETRTQVRLLGTMSMAAENDEELAAARLKTWTERTDESRQSFTWPHAGEPLSPDSSFRQPSPHHPPENFALLVFAPEQVDTLGLTSQPHARERHILRTGEWISARINP